MRLWRTAALVTAMLACSTPAAGQAPDLVRHADSLHRPPRLQNPEAVGRAIVEHYPPPLLARRIGGKPLLELRVDRIGLVYDVKVESSGGHPLFGEAALEVADSMQFEPGVRNGEPAEYKVKVPVHFQPAVSPEVRSAETCQRSPALANREKLAELLEEHVPRTVDTREAGTRRVLIAIVVDAGGLLRTVEIAESSGDEAADATALVIASEAEFRPRMGHGGPAYCKLTIPVSIRVD